MQKNVDVVEASYWVIGHMSELVLPNSSDVAAVAVCVGMFWHGWLLEVW